MVFIKRTRHTMRILVHVSDTCVCSMVKETTVVSVVTVDGYNLGEVTEQISVVDQQRNLVVVIRVHDDDTSVGLTIGFEETTLAVVDNSVSNDGSFQVVQ